MCLTELKHLDCQKSAPPASSVVSTLCLHSSAQFALSSDAPYSQWKSNLWCESCEMNDLDSWVSLRVWDVVLLNLRVFFFQFPVVEVVRVMFSFSLCLLSSVYSCALLRDILLQGRLYISRNWLCFCANLFGKDIKVRMTDRHFNKVKLKLTDKLEPSNCGRQSVRRTGQTDSLFKWESVRITVWLPVWLPHFHSSSISLCMGWQIWTWTAPRAGRLLEPSTFKVMWLSLSYAANCSFSFISLKPLLSS